MSEESNIPKIKNYLVTSEVIRRYGVTKRQLLYWNKIGILNSNIVGRERRYSFVSLLQLKFILELRNEGVSIQTIRRAVDRLRLNSNIPNEPLTEYKVFTDGKEVYVSKNDKIWNASTSQYQLFELNLKKLEEDTCNVLPPQKGTIYLRDIFSKKAL